MVSEIRYYTNQIYTRVCNLNYNLVTRVLFY